jgi:hypothetical protein
MTKDVMTGQNIMKLIESNIYDMGSDLESVSAVMETKMGVFDIPTDKCYFLDDIIINGTVCMSAPCYAVNVTGIQLSPETEVMSIKLANIGMFEKYDARVLAAVQLIQTYDSK